MKKLFIALMLCMVSIMVFGQDRVNRPKLQFTQEGGVITEFTGWLYNEQCGEWIGCKNTIMPTYYGCEKKDLAEWEGSKADVLNNIISLQIKTLIYNNQLYYVIIWNTWDGAYKYPSIREDWEYWKTKRFLMLTENDMNKLKNLTNTQQKIKVQHILQSRYDSKVMDCDIIQTNMSKSYKDYIYLTIYKATDTNIRFLFEDHTGISRIDNETKIDKQYFEISENDYIKFIDIQ